LRKAKRVVKLDLGGARVPYKIQNLGPNMKKILLLFVTFFCILLLTSCGFHLRQGQTLPPILRNMYVQSIDPYSAFTLSLEDALRANNINLVSSQKNSTSTLEIRSIAFTHSGATAYSSAQANVYTFTLSVGFAVNTQSGKALLPQQAVSATRSLTFSPNEVLESSNQVSAARQEMEQEVIMKILNILNAKEIAKAAEANHNENLSSTTRIKPSKGISKHLYHQW